MQLTDILLSIIPAAIVGLLFGLVLAQILETGRLRRSIAKVRDEMKELDYGISRRITAIEDEARSGRLRSSVEIEKVAAEWKGYLEQVQKLYNKTNEEMARLETKIAAVASIRQQRTVPQQPPFLGG